MPLSPFHLFTLSPLLHSHHLVLPAAQSDFLGMREAGLVFGVWIAVEEVIVMIVEVGLGHFVRNLAIRQGCLLKASVGAGLVKGERIERCEHAYVRNDGCIVACVAVTVW